MAISSINAFNPYQDYQQHSLGMLDKRRDGENDDVGIAKFKTQQPQKSDNENDLTDEEKAQVAELKARDQEVRQHEAAHQAAGGAYTGSASYSYERGPDGIMYAIGGEVSVDTSVISGDPEATIAKMRTIHAAAMAPKDPSPQDYKVAADAMMKLMQAQIELQKTMGADDESTAHGSSQSDHNHAINSYKAMAAIA